MSDNGAPLAADICVRHGNRPDTLIEILHELQDAIGYVPKETLPVIAEALNLSRAEVYGVLSFYHDFHTAPKGKHTIALCRAEACQSVGCEALARHAEQKLGVKFGETTADGAFTLKPVYCLGNCALAPAMMLDGRLYGRLDADKFDAAVKKAETQ